MINFVPRRTVAAVATSANDIGRIFFKENVQKLLTDITRFEEEKVFSRRPVRYLKSPKMVFMTEKMLEHARQNAYDEVKARLQMPPVMAADNSKPLILAKDEEIVGYTKYKVLFIDIAQGYSNRERLMSVRETDGTLRLPTFEERARLNHIFFGGSAAIDTPKMFEDKRLEDGLNKKNYLFILNRACIQFEPDDPRYVSITSKVYDHINKKGDYDMLRSTRHFGPLALYLAYNKDADNLIMEMLSKSLVDDAAKLVKVYYNCHGVPYEDEPAESPIDVIQAYSNNYSNAKHNLDLALQALSQ